MLEAPGIDPGTSRMLSERSTIWATPPIVKASKLCTTFYTRFKYITEITANAMNLFKYSETS